MTTSNDVILQMLRRVDPDAYSGTATGGSTTTTVDSGMPAYSDDYFNGGFIYFSSGANAGLIRKITDFVDSTNTITHTSATAVASGVSFTATRLPLSQFIDAINAALLEIGPVLKSDTDLTATADTYWYGIPTISHVRRVYTYASGEEKVVNLHWTETAGGLYFAKGGEPDAGDTIEIIYAAPDTAVSETPSTFSNDIPVQVLVWGAVYHWLYARSMTPTNNTPDMQASLKSAREMYQEMRSRYPTRAAIGIDPKLALH